MVQRSAAVVRGVYKMGLMNQAPAGLCFVGATHRGVQRGEAPLQLLQSPKSGGSKGADLDAEKALLMRR